MWRLPRAVARSSAASPNNSKVARPIMVGSSQSVCFRRSWFSSSSPSALDTVSGFVASQGTTSALFGDAAAAFRPPPDAENLRDRLRRLGGEAEKEAPDSPKRLEAIAEATAALQGTHPLVRLAGIHTLARVSPQGDPAAWRKVSALIKDEDELVQVAVARAVGRMAAIGDDEAISWLQDAQAIAKFESVRLAAKDAEARVRGVFAAAQLAGGDGQTSAIAASSSFG
mmetsp:Transcript_69756/g.152213  ORF Transcript_69756/g.152213 Transcript_69756/m.152213 type:complete len:227 (-) Transcript_69756:464-1144(-)